MYHGAVLFWIMLFCESELYLQNLAVYSESDLMWYFYHYFRKSQFSCIKTYLRLHFLESVLLGFLFKWVL